MWWLAAVIGVALNLRPAVASLPPMIDSIATTLNLSATASGLLTTLPVVCMGLFAPVAALAARRFGPDRVLAGSVGLIAVGTAVRALAGAVGLYTGAVLAGAGIAVAGALLPALVKAAFPDRIGPVTGLYTAGLIGGALLAAAATEPVRVALGVSWQVALALWALPAATALAGWLRLTRPGHRSSAPNSAAPPAAPAVAGMPWRDRTVWLATAFMGGQSLLYYGSLAWLSARYTSLGVPTAEAGLLLGVFSATQLVSALSLPALAHRGGDTRPWIALSVGASTMALALVAVAPLAAPWTWAALLGLGMGGQFALALTVLAEIAPTPHAAAAISGLAFFVGYLVASLGPVAAGVLRDLTGGFVAPFLALAAVGVATLAAGVAIPRRPPRRLRPLPRRPRPLPRRSRGYSRSPISNHEPNS